MTIKYHETQCKAFFTKHDYSPATYYTVDAAPVIVGVDVYVNGNKATVGDGQRDKCCYFSGDGGLSARKLNGIQFGDKLYWVGSEAGHNLSNSDKIGFRFASSAPEPVTQPAVRGYNGVMKFLEQIIGDEDESTMEERLKAAEIYLQYKGIPERDLKAEAEFRKVSDANAQTILSAFQMGNAAPATTNNYTHPHQRLALEVSYIHITTAEGMKVRVVKSVYPVDGNSIKIANPPSEEQYWVQVADDKVLASFAHDEIVFLGNFLGTDQV
jgi:hypothetical protein